MPSRPDPVIRLVACAFSAMLAMSTASAQSVPATATARPTAVAEPRFDTVPVVGGTSSANYVTTLEAWLRGNAGRRVTTLTSVLAYRDDARAFVLGSVAGDNAGLSFDVVPTNIAGAMGATGANDVPYGNDLTAYAGTHPSRRIVAFTGIPSYSGGIKAFVVLVEPRDAPPLTGPHVPPLLTTRASPPPSR